MFESVDATLRAFLADALPEGVALAFELPPEGDGPPAAPARAVNAYLHAVEEDLSARSHGVVSTRTDDGRVTARRALPRRFALSYLVTATAPSVADEHALLGSVVQALSRYDIVPPEHIAAELVGSGDLTVSFGPPLPWLGYDSSVPRLHVHVVVTVPVAPPAITDLPPAPEVVQLGPQQLPRRPATPPAEDRPKPAARISEG